MNVSFFWIHPVDSHLNKYCRIKLFYLVFVCLQCCHCTAKFWAYFTLFLFVCSVAILPCFCLFTVLPLHSQVLGFMSSTSTTTTARIWQEVRLKLQKCVQSHQNDAHVGSYMLIIQSFYLCPYSCPLNKELSNDEA